MIATFFGGPKDGATAEVPDGATQVAIYLPLMVPHHPDEPIVPDEDVPSITRRLPVERLTDGRVIIRW